MKIEWKHTSELFIPKLRKIVEKRISELNLQKIATALYDLNWNEPNEPYLEITFEININEKIPINNQLDSLCRVFDLIFSTDEADSFFIEVNEFRNPHLIAISESIKFNEAQK